MGKAAGKFSYECPSRASMLRFAVGLACVLLFLAYAAPAQNQYEKRPISRVEIALGDTRPSTAVVEEYRQIARNAVGSTYSTPRIREAIEALYDTRRIDTIAVSAAVDASGSVELTFSIKRKPQAGRVEIIVSPSEGDVVREEDLRLRLNLLMPGSTFTEQTLEENADQILDYLRDRGFFRSTVTFERRPLEDQNDIGVTFRVTPGAQAMIERFQVNIEGFTRRIEPNELNLEAGDPFSYDRLQKDVEEIRGWLRDDGFLAPQIDDPKITYDGERNTISVAITGRSGPKVEVVVESEGENVSKRTQTRLLPIRRDGTLDYSAIVEGARRLENYFQEKGYFFADVTPVCSSTPAITDTENVPIANDSEFLCQYLTSTELMGREIVVRYRAGLNRRLTLERLRLRGTDKLTIEDIRSVLASQEANILGIIPILGYGRGYTSQAMLDADAETIRSLMAELGYRDASVVAAQGVDPNGENLIITFIVEEGVPSVVTDVSIVGNSVFSTDTLRAQLPPLEGLNYSRAKERNAVQRLRQYYADRGYYDRKVTSKVVSGLDGPPGVDRREVKLQFVIENEGKPVVVNRILVTGNEKTRESAVRRALALQNGELLKASDVYLSEQNLYSSDAFSVVEIRPQPAGDGPDGTRLSDILVNLEEQPPRIMSYGGGYSTDVGLSGFFDIRHMNLFGRLWQGGARVKVSQRQQLVQFDFLNPRFLRDGEKRWAPFTFTAQYQRDTTVTRFFRSAFDRGTFGIVQRVDPDGNPIDEFGRNIGSPTLNRLTLSAETSRTISRADRSLIFFRYRFEDVRLYNIGSLLIKDLLEPDRKTRISGFTTTFVRDTRQSCTVRQSLLDLIARGEPSEPCRYNATDPTKGDYLTADYNVSLPALGANVGFHKFQASYQFYYTFRRPRSTTIAARAIVGVARVFAGGDRYTNSQFPSLNGLLPISERFFAGGSNNLRGFDFEEAGPRVVIVPQGTFLNSDGEQVFLDPFTVPFGGNAVAVTNIEARIPLSNTVRIVPFYDGGNVFRRASDIFRRPVLAPNDIAAANQRAVWTHTIGLGLRLRTPVGGELGVDYGHLLNPPTFLIPQAMGPPAMYRLRPSHLHFRFSQAF